MLDFDQALEVLTGQLELAVVLLAVSLLPLLGFLRRPHFGLFSGHSQILLVLPLAASVWMFHAADEQWKYFLDNGLHHGDSIDHAYYLRITAAGLVALAVIFGSLPLLRRKFGARPSAMRWLVVAPSVIACATTWLALSNAGPYVQDLGPFFWPKIYALAIITTYLAVAATVRDTTSPLPGTLLVAALLTWLLSIRFALLMTLSVFNADLIWIFTASASCVLFSATAMSGVWPRRRLISVLYLRRFGESPINETIKATIRKCGKDAPFRLITLDDRKFVPATPSRRPVGLALTNVLMFLVPSVAGLVLAALNFSTLFGIAEGVTSGYVTLLAVGISIGILATFIIPALVFCLMGLARASARRQANVGSVDSLPRAIRHIGIYQCGVNRVQKLSLAANTIVSTANDCWRETVLRFAKRADIVVMEASDLSPAVEWELHQLVDLDRLHTTVVLLDSNAHDGAYLERFGGSAACVLEYASPSALEVSLNEKLVQMAQTAPQPAAQEDFMHYSDGERSLELAYCLRLIVLGLLFASIPNLVPFVEVIHEVEALELAYWGFVWVGDFLAVLFFSLALWRLSRFRLLIDQ